MSTSANKISVPRLVTPLRFAALATAIALQSALPQTAAALEPASSTNFKTLRAAIAPGGTIQSNSTNFKVQPALVGQSLTRLQSSQQLPVNLSGFSVD